VSAIKSISDEQIMDLLRSEKTYERGFGLLLQKYKERLYWHIRGIVITHEDTDDVLQNTYIKVYRGILKFEEKSKLYTWLYRIATNEALTHLQSKNSKSNQSLEDMSAFLSNQLLADAWFDGEEAQTKLQDAIVQLPDKQRIVFNMRYFQEMPYEEMSGVLETSVGALKASFHHAVKKIEAIFLIEN
jgi:RNA polymerase sigma-70 factor, ECF subfamily